MKAIIMAAGRGSRISSQINGMHKSTLKVGGDSIISRTVTMLLSRGIDVCVVVGYRQDDIRVELNGLPVTFIENPFFNVTNSLASLWLAKEQWSDESVLLINSDLFMEDAILDAIIKDPRSPVMAADPHPRRIREGDFFFKYTSQLHLTDYGKELPLNERTGEYLGIAKVNQSDRDSCLLSLGDLVKSGCYDDWWESILYCRVPKGEMVHVLEVNDCYWSEVDVIEDYISLQHAFALRDPNA